MSNKEKETKEMIETLALLYSISEDKLSYYDSGTEIQIFTNNLDKPILNLYSDKVEEYVENIYSKPIDSVTVEDNNGISIIIQYESDSKNKFQIN